MKEFCVDDRHGVPCPQPCNACSQECSLSDSVEAVSQVEAARKAGWSEEYIEQMVLS